MKNLFLRKEKENCVEKLQGWLSLPPSLGSSFFERLGIAVAVLLEIVDISLEGVGFNLTQQTLSSVANGVCLRAWSICWNQLRINP